MKKILGVIVLLAAYACLYPGVTLPILTLKGEVEKSDLVQVGKDLIIESPETPPLLDTMADALLSQMRPEGTVDVYEKTRSILGTAQDLHVNGFTLVAVLIILFSVLIPLLKLLLILLASVASKQSLCRKLHAFSGSLAKWSMADVFVIGLFVAFLAANGIQQSDAMLNFTATLGTGFYFFLGYCLLSVLSSQLLEQPLRFSANRDQSMS
ncbi:MAG: paraquat-inducible protein A [Pseudomonadota bacterium]